MKQARVEVLFVCMGNICRSPTAHGVMDHLVRQHGLTELVFVDSAGTHAYHIGEQPDPRSQQTARRRGLDLSYQRARKVLPEDIERFEYVLAMDNSNYQNLLAICPSGLEHKVKLFMDFARNRSEREVPDPYYGGPSGFENVFDMVEDAALGLLDDIRSRHLKG